MMLKSFSMQYLILFIFFFSLNAQANICDTIFRSSNVGCTDLSTSHSSGGSYPLLFDAFNFSPSALPTFPTPVGVEGYYNNGRVNAAIIKGTQGAGFGASIKKTDTTFFSGAENYKVALKQSSTPYSSTSLDQFFNMGTALNYTKLPIIKNIPIGLAYRYNPDKKVWSFHPGFEIRTTYLTLGASFYEEKPAKYFDGYYDVQEKRENLSVSASLRFKILIFDYSLLQQENNTTYTQSNVAVSNIRNSYTVTTQIMSGTIVYQNFSGSFAYRTQDDTRLTGSYATLSGGEYNKSHILAGGAYKTNHLEIGAFYNYVLNEDISAVCKIFF